MNSREFSSMNHAVLNGHACRTRLLLRAGSNANARDNHRRTPLMLVTLYSDERKALLMAKQLIKSGGKIDLADDRGMNALHHACQRKKEELAEYFLRFVDNFDVFAADDTGKTCLHYAKDSGSVIIVDRLELIANTYGVNIDILLNRSQLTVNSLPSDFEELNEHKVVQWAMPNNRSTKTKCRINEDTNRRPATSPLATINMKSQPSAISSLHRIETRGRDYRLGKDSLRSQFSSRANERNSKELLVEIYKIYEQAACSSFRQSAHESERDERFPPSLVPSPYAQDRSMEESKIKINQDSSSPIFHKRRESRSMSVCYDGSTTPKISLPNKSRPKRISLQHLSTTTPANQSRQASTKLRRYSSSISPLSDYGNSLIDKEENPVERLSTSAPNLQGIRLYNLERLSPRFSNSNTPPGEEQLFSLLLQRNPSPGGKKMYRQISSSPSLQTFQESADKIE